MSHVDTIAYREILAQTEARGAILVAVSKTKPVEAIMELYELGQRDFGENYVQELVDKEAQLPKDIRWHFVGHLQRNKVKQIAPFVHLIHGVDSMRLLQEVNARGAGIGRMIDVLLQVHVAREETKHGFSPEELREEFTQTEIHLQAWARISGLMGMTTFTEDRSVVAGELQTLKSLYDEIGKTYYDRRPEWNTLSMGMSGDYALALEHGSTMIRVGSLLFGARNLKRT